jgi:hypothetical protein
MSLYIVVCCKYIDVLIRTTYCLSFMFLNYFHSTVLLFHRFEFNNRPINYIIYNKMLSFWKSIFFISILFRNIHQLNVFIKNKFLIKLLFKNWLQFVFITYSAGSRILEGRGDRPPPKSATEYVHFISIITRKSQNKHTRINYLQIERN